ncbi:hypothetical protein LDI01_12170 [Lentilactobacillus diolivorans]|uniref:Uncharacterized protein n=1 Tax=Lentilactobacillus diolivorans TaxID=179838 RepID=A0ABQ0XD92_9LACO|nr:hypothetical protein LDI01_12170 [Lentilactobacillus diolivorans]
MSLFSCEESGSCLPQSKNGSPIINELPFFDLIKLISCNLSLQIYTGLYSLKQHQAKLVLINLFCNCQYKYDPFPTHLGFARQSDPHF